MTNNYLMRLVREAVREYASETPCTIDYADAINGERVNIDEVLIKYWPEYGIEEGRLRGTGEKVGR